MTHPLYEHPRYDRLRSTRVSEAEPCVKEIEKPLEIVGFNDDGSPVYGEIITNTGDK